MQQIERANGGPYPGPAARVPVNVPRADPARLAGHVRALEGERHPDGSPEALERAVAYVERELAGLGLHPERHPFRFAGRPFANVAAELAGTDPAAPRLLVGAHLDTVRGTPGADDNASGVAGMLECARLLAGWRGRATLELAAFNLEERQGLTYRVGSRRWAAHARACGVRYRGALVLEMIGFRSRTLGSQRIPVPIRWMRLPRVGDYLAVVGDTRSRTLLRAFVAEAARAAPGLPVVSLHSPCGAGSSGPPVGATTPRSGPRAIRLSSSPTLPTCAIRTTTGPATGSRRWISPSPLRWSTRSQHACASSRAKPERAEWHLRARRGGCDLRARTAEWSV